MVNCGLFHSQTREQLPLDGVHVAVQIVNLVAEVQIVQFFVNASATPIDCIYEFPMDDAAAVCGFEVELSDRLLIGEVKEKQEARAEYNAAIARGEAAALLEQNKPDVFLQRIGNIPALSRVNIRIIYVTELKVDRETGGAIFVLPTSVSPRYSPYFATAIPCTRPWHQVCCGRRIVAPGGYSSWDGRVETLPWQPWTHNVPQFVVNEQRPGAFSITIEAEMASRVLSMESKTYQINVEHADPSVNKVSASLWNQTEPMGKDLDVIIYQEKPHEPSVQVEMALDGTGCAMLTLVPEFEFAPVQTEIVFLVDCSGSMEGERIEAAKRALEVFLQSLPVSCHFNIVRFGSSFDSLNKRRPFAYNSANLTSAKKYLSQIMANLGGTEIARPLGEILKTKPLGGTCRQVFVLTDGQVSNTEEVIHLCREYASHNRVFSVGIGNEVSRHLVEGIARAANGTSEFILGNELGSGSHALEVRLMNQLKLATYPGINKILVDWFAGENAPVAQVASVAPSRFFPTGPAATPGAMVFNGQAPRNGPSPHSVGSGTWHMPADVSGAQPLGRNDLAYQAPFLPRPLFSGTKFLMFCFLKSPATMTHVNVVAEAPGGELSLSVPVTRVSSIGKTIHTLAARALIRDLDEETSHLHYRKVVPQGQNTFAACRPFSSWLGTTVAKDGRAAAWNLQPITIRPEVVKTEMVEIGTKYGIVSKHTSFVAVERFRDGRIGSAQAPPSLPSAAPVPAAAQRAFASAPLSRSSRSRGFAARMPAPSRGRQMEAAMPMMALHSVKFKAKMARSDEAADDEDDEDLFASDDEADRSYESSLRAKVAAAKASLPKADQAMTHASTASYRDVLGLQHFDGSIEVSEKAANVLGYSSLAEVRDTYKTRFGLATIVGLDLDQIYLGFAFLQALAKRYASTKEIWEMAADKTRGWVLAQLAVVDPNTPRTQHLAWIESNIG